MTSNIAWGLMIPGMGMSEEYQVKQQPISFDTLGNAALLDRPSRTALFCSNKCPGGIILNCQDWANGLIGSDTIIISGFHTPVEKDVFRILLRGKHPTVICPARSLTNMRVPSTWRAEIEAGTLCLAADFAPTTRRATTHTAEQRNRFVASLAKSILIPYAAPGSKTESLAKNFLSTKRVVYTFDSPNTKNLQDLGCVKFEETPNNL